MNIFENRFNHHFLCTTVSQNMVPVLLWCSSPGVIFGITIDNRYLWALFLFWIYLDELVHITYVKVIIVDLRCKSIKTEICISHGLFPHGIRTFSCFRGYQAIWIWEPLRYAVWTELPFQESWISLRWLLPPPTTVAMCLITELFPSVSFMMLDFGRCALKSLFMFKLTERYI
jgi:hypothetical protein